jgi:hypothetical protein
MASEDFARQLKTAPDDCASLKEENLRLISLFSILEGKSNAMLAGGRQGYAVS